ncbi:MAG: HsmA family protein [Lachnospiraceae bacterium]|nr:HsmA family protein [Lachnospiraceae bacterium]
MDFTGFIAQNIQHQCGHLAGAAEPGALLSFHAVTGYIAVILMIIHAVWAVVTLISHDEKRKATFHRFSVFVWGVWLIPFVIGMVMGMKG